MVTFTYHETPEGATLTYSFSGPPTTAEEALAAFKRSVAETVECRAKEIFQWIV